MFIAFISDFGTRDSYAGTVKGVIATINPSARIIDITHGIPPHDIMAGALTLGATYRYFPKGTIFLAVVDPGVGSDRKAMIASAGDYLFVMPDNGLLTGLVKSGRPIRKNDLSCRQIENPALILETASSTFHARDIFGPAAAHLSLGTRPEDFGKVIKKPVELNWPEPVAGRDGISGEIIYIDTFGNLVTNIPSSAVTILGQNAECLCITEDRRKITLPVLESYSDVPNGAGLCLEGSFGFMEVAVNRGSAARLLGMGPGARIEIRLPEQDVMKSA